MQQMRAIILNGRNNSWG